MSGNSSDIHGITEKYFAYMVPVACESYRKLYGSLAIKGLPVYRKSILTLEEENSNSYITKCIILCKVSVNPSVIGNESGVQNLDEYIDFISNGSEEIDSINRCKIFGEIKSDGENDKNGIYIHNFEYLIIPISDYFQYKNCATLEELCMTTGVSQLKCILSKICYICSEFPFSLNSGRKFDVYDLTDKKELCDQVLEKISKTPGLSGVSELYKTINSVVINEDIICKLWNACFAYGSSGRSNILSNHHQTTEDMANSMFDFAFENYDRFANNVANGNLFNRHFGIESTNDKETINIVSFLSCNPNYRCVSTLYHKNDLPNLTISDVMGDVVARQYKQPDGKFQPNFTHVSSRHYFIEEYRNSKPSMDNSLFPFAATSMINSLSNNMANNITPFKFQFNYTETTRNITTNRPNGTVITTVPEIKLKYKVFIHPIFLRRIINKDGSIKQTVKSLSKFITPDSSQKLKMVIVSPMECIFNNNELGSYWPSKNIQEFNSVKTNIKMPLFSYQKRNVSWMDEIEKQVKDGKHSMDFKNLGLFEYLLKKQEEVDLASIVEFNIGNSSYNSVILRNGTNIPIPSKLSPTIKLSGGVLADDVGLGKTLSVISHLVAQYNNDKAAYLAGEFDCNTLVIIPPRLLKQWIYEIEKYTPVGMFNIISLASITDIKKYAIKKNAEFRELSEGNSLDGEHNSEGTQPGKGDETNAEKGNETHGVKGNETFIMRGAFRVPNSLKADYKVLITQLIEDLGISDISCNISHINEDGTIAVKNQLESHIVNESGINVMNGKDISKGGSHVRSPAKKMDIVIMSANLLSNLGYREYLNSAYNANGQQTGYDFYSADYIDIFRINWNRIVVDEAHERIKTEISRDTLDMETKTISYSIIHLLQSKYRWALTATPFENTYSNLLGYLLWLMPESKIKINSLSASRLSDIYNSKSAHSFVSELNDINIMNINVKNLVNSCEYLDIQKKIISKTSKRSVSSEINIPIFTEEIRPIQLGTIERNIYNNAKTSNSYKGDKLRRLFELCTNICISTEDIANLGIDPNKTMTLEELNKAMISNFGRQLESVMNDLQEAQRELPLCERKKDLAAKIQANLRVLEPRLGQRNLSINNQYRNFVESAFSHDESGGYGYGSDPYETRDKKVLKKLRKELYSRLLECESFSEMIIGITIEIMDSFGVDRPTWDEYLVLYVVDYMLGTFSTRSDRQQKTIEENIAKLEREKVRLTNQIKLFENNDFIKEKTSEPCSICWTDYTEDTRIAVTQCRHVYCGDCFAAMSVNKTSIPCPECRADILVKSINITNMRDLIESKKPDMSEQESVNSNNTVKIPVPEWKIECISKYGTKMATLIEILKELFATSSNRVIIFSQYDLMLKLIGRTLSDYGIKNVYARGNVRVVNKNIDTFKRDESIRVIMLSSEHSNSGSNLTEASHIILVDVLNMNMDQTKQIETQAIGRAVRLGQRKPVKVIRLITQDTIESETYAINKYDIMTIQ